MSLKYETKFVQEGFLRINIHLIHVKVTHEGLTVTDLYNSIATGTLKGLAESSDVYNRM